jgi:hypothetical protein
MSFFALCASRRSIIALVGLFFVVDLAGCNSSQNANQAAVGISAAGGSETDGSKFDKFREFQKLPLAKFAGRVTVDGKPPKKGCKVFLVLADAKHPDENSHGILPKFYTACDDDGNFAFTTYDKGDGVPVAKYVVTFMEFHPAVARASKGSARAPAAFSSHPQQRFMGPDEFKNLYSNPDTNVKDKQFNLDLQAPGKDDYHFDLAVAGKAGSEPAPHALRTLLLRP